jgi:hypothetical protein
VKDIAKEHPLAFLFFGVLFLMAVGIVLVEIEHLIEQLFNYALIVILGGLATGGGVYALARAKHPEHLEAFFDKHTGRNQTPQISKPTIIDLDAEASRDNPYRIPRNQRRESRGNKRG